MVEITKNEFEVLNLYSKDIFLESTIREIMKKLKKKSYQRVYESIKELKRKNILKLEKMGSSIKVSLSLSHETLVYLTFLEEKKSLSKNIPNKDKILSINEIKEDIILITGSYANSKQTKDSDIDLVILTKEGEVWKQKLLDNKTQLLTSKFHNIVLNYKDFLEMLKSKEENFGKEIFKKHLILKNANNYYQLIIEAIENGFRG